MCVGNPALTAVCRALEMPSWKEREMFCRVGAAKSRFVEFLLLVFQRTEEGWGLCACSAPCGWAPLAEQANTSVLWEHRKGSAQRISSL